MVMMLHLQAQLFWIRYPKYVPSSNFTLVHHLEDLWQLFQVHCLERSVDEAAFEEIKSFRTVLSVAHIRALNSHHLEHRLKHGCANRGTSRQTNHNDSASRPDIFGGLLEGLLGDSH